jgi:flagellar protein FliJ
MAFRFRLQSVLQYKQKVEDDRKLEMAALLTEVAEQELRLAALDADRERVRAEVLNGMAGEVDIEAVARGFRHAEWLDELRLRQAELIAELRQRIEAKRQEVVEAMQGRQALEKLRDRDRASYEAELLHAEQTLMDELSTSRYAARPAASAAAG